MEKKYSFFFIIFITLLYNGCSAMHSIGVDTKMIKSDKDRIFDDIKYLASSEEEDEYNNLKSDELIEDFIIKFWERRDPTPGTALNEIKAEYYKRKEIADERFKGVTKGSLTDRGRVLIMYGDPERIEFYNSGDMYLNGSKIVSLELWLYDRIAGTAEMPNKFYHVHNGRMKFIFADFHGYGLYSQIYSSEKNEFTDSRVYFSTGF